MELAVVKSYAYFYRFPLKLCPVFSKEILKYEPDFKHTMVNTCYKSWFFRTDNGIAETHTPEVLESVFFVNTADESRNKAFKKMGI